MKKILFIIGSLRVKSFNRQVAHVAKEIIGGCAEVQELDYSELPLKDYSQGSLHRGMAIHSFRSASDIFSIA